MARIINFISQVPVLEQYRRLTPTEEEAKNEFK